jgi:hypothetical protein
MAGGGWADLEWHEQIARRIEAARRRPLRIRDLVGAVVVSGVVFGLLRFSADVFGGPAVAPMITWLAAVAVAGVLAILGVSAALMLGRVAMALYAWGQGRSGLLASAAMGASVVVDFVAIGLLMTLALGVTLFLVVSTMMLWMSLS